MVAGRVRQSPRHLADTQPQGRLLEVGRGLAVASEKACRHRSPCGIELSRLVNLRKDCGRAHAIVHPSWVLGRTGNDGVVAREVVVFGLRVDNALLGGDLLGCWDVGDSEVCFA